MSSSEDLKRKSVIKLEKNNNKEFHSCPNIIKFFPLDNTKDMKIWAPKRTRSEPDIAKLLQKTQEEQIKDQQYENRLKYESMKSERNLSILYNSSTPYNNNNNNNIINNSDSIPSSPFRSNINTTMDLSCYSMINNNDVVKIPIVGYEIVAERSRFTIFKLRIENYENNNFWLVLRRFTDFTRLQAKLKTLYPHINLMLPKKKWFGNNFSTAFLDSRIAGLQTFINTILSNKEMRSCPTVREFFCLDEPPMFTEEISEDCRMVVESQNETIAHLQMQLRAKDEVIANLTHSLKVQKQHNDYLTSLLVKSSQN